MMGYAYWLSLVLLTTLANDLNEQEITAPTAWAGQNNCISAISNIEAVRTSFSRTLAGAPLQLDNSNANTEKAFQSLRRTTWYDPTTKDYAPPEISPERDNEIRTTGRVAKAVAKQRSTSNWGNWFSALGRFLASFFSWTLVIVIAALLIIAVGALIFFMFRDYLPSRREQMGSKKGIEIDLARVEELPFEVRAASLDPLSEAHRLMRAGNFDSAIIYLYGYMLLALDQSRQIHLQKGKTNRMYLRELNRGGNASLRRIVESTMLAFEQVYFGKHSLTAEHFHALWERVEEFNHLVSPKVEPGRAQSAVEIAPT